MLSVGIPIRPSAPLVVALANRPGEYPAINLFSRAAYGGALILEDGSNRYWRTTASAIPVPSIPL
jgi:hypothetical protein